MSYTTTNNKIQFNKKIVKAEFKSFTIIDANFAKDKTQVFYKGKSYPLNPKNFKNHRNYFVQDDTKVYLVMKTKLKPIKATVKTFEHLGGYYATDGKKYFWFDKIFKVKDKKHFKVVADEYALNQDFVYCQNQASRLKDYSDFNWQQSDLSHYQTFSVDKTAGGKELYQILCLKEAVLFFEYGLLLRIQPHPQAHKLKLLKAMTTDNVWLGDATHLIGLRDEYILTSGQAYKLYTHAIVGNSLYIGQDTYPIDFETATHLQGGYFDKNQVIQTNYGEKVLFQKPLSPIETEDSLAAIKDLFNTLLYILDNYVPSSGVCFDHQTGVNITPETICLSASDQVQEIEFSDNLLTIKNKQVQITGQISDYISLLGKFWIKTRNMNVKGVENTRILYRRENVNYIEDYLISFHTKNCLIFLQETEKNSLKEARIIATMYRQNYEDIVDSSIQILAPNLPQTLLEAPDINILSHSIFSELGTTYTAFANNAIKNIKTKNEPLRFVLAKSFFYGCAELSKIEAINLSAAIDHCRQENNSNIRNTLLCAIDIIVARSLWLIVRKDALKIYKRTTTLCQFLVEQSFNADHNLVRLAECEHYLSYFEPRKDLKKIQLQIKESDFFKSAIPAPPQNRYYAIAPNYRLWFVMSYFRVLKNVQPHSSDTAVFKKLFQENFSILNQSRQQISGFSMAFFNDAFFTVREAAKNLEMDLPILDKTYQAANTGYSNKYQTINEATYDVLGDLKVVQQGQYVTNMINGNDYRLIALGPKQTVKLGSRIGIEVFIEGLPWGRKIPSTVTWEHPLINGKKKHTYHYKICLGVITNYYWKFEDESELVAGDWKVSIHVNELKTIASTNFKISLKE